MELFITCPKTTTTIVLHSYISNHIVRGLWTGLKPFIFNPVQDDMESTSICRLCIYKKKVVVLKIKVVLLKGQIAL